MDLRGALQHTCLYDARNPLLRLVTGEHVNRHVDLTIMTWLVASFGSEFDQEAQLGDLPFDLGGMKRETEVNASKKGVRLRNRSGPRRIKLRGFLKVGLGYLSTLTSPRVLIVGIKSDFRLCDGRRESPCSPLHRFCVDCGPWLRIISAGNKRENPSRMTPSADKWSD